ncbi:MAG: WYL domain-containing protein [Desulfotomaculaceae bacterium]|nr:WYL domain-containing protein [Desulfotomaculaceae bacterium]
MEQLQERIHVVEEQLADPDRVGEIFAMLVQAVKESHRVKLRYYVAYRGEDSQRVVEPYGLICKRHNWYLVGYCLKRNDIRVFRVDQVSAVIPYTDERFAYPEDFSLKDYMARSWGVINDGVVRRVRLKFSPQVARRVKSLVYHPSQRIREDLADGSVVISLEICGIDEMKTWIVQWGDMVEVLEPWWLREEMCAMARRMLEVYE